MIQNRYDNNDDAMFTYIMCVVRINATKHKHAGYVQPYLVPKVNHKEIKVSSTYISVIKE